ncbi:MAG: hypothetical protein H7123_00825, partial [Thermoleophilia bacterium]|nr:hypothetical protein [Thermoleophilia bacterium]
LSGVVSKAAAFGMLVVVLPAYPHLLSGGWGDGIIWVSILSLLYGSITAFRQPDVRGVIAYSSMAQMGLIALGFATYLGAGGEQGVSGAYMQSINHGIISAALFLIAGMIELRTGTGILARLGGLAGGRPVLATVALVVTMCALAVPGSNAFAGELMILLGTFRAAWEHAWIWAAIASLAIVLAAMYALRLLSAMNHAPEENTLAAAEQSRSSFGLDLRLPELSFLMPLVAVLVVLSVWPNAIRREMNERPVQLPIVKDVRK